MKFYIKQHRFYCGIDLHANAMFVCVLDSTGEVVLHKNIPTRPKAFLRLIKPYREDLVVGCECMFTWYWLADLCANEEIDFVLGHALYMRAIHGGKAKNDKIDSHKIAVLLRGGSFPVAYTYPKKMRATRDLLQRPIIWRASGPNSMPISKIPPLSTICQSLWAGLPSRVSVEI